MEPTREELRAAIAYIRQGHVKVVAPVNLSAIAELAARQLALIEAAERLDIDQAPDGPRP
jgi:hypothetical protein